VGAFVLRHAGLVAQHLHALHVTVEKFVEITDDIPIAEENNRLLIARAFGVRLTVCGAQDIASARTNFLEVTIRAMETQFPLQNERYVGRVMPMQHGLLVRGKFEYYVYDAILPAIPAPVLKSLSSSVSAEQLRGLTQADVIKNGMTPEAAVAKAFHRAEEIFAQYPI
jgi:hypothetical protein